MRHALTETQWVTFYLGEELFACPILSIQEIIPYKEPIPVPGSASAIEGILNVRGEIIPVVSGTELTGAANGNQKETQNNIIIMESNEGMLGITIDSVSEIIQIEPQAIEYENHQASSINGSALHDGKLVILLDIKPETLS